jgi:hypothetical protein
VASPTPAPHLHPPEVFFPSSSLHTSCRCLEFLLAKDGLPPPFPLPSPSFLNCRDILCLCPPAVLTHCRPPCWCACASSPAPVPPVRDGGFG